MKFLMGQINTTPCDFEGNLRQILDGVEMAGKAGCKLAVFPELSIPGYLSQDLMYDHDFVDRNYESVQKIQDLSKTFPKLRIVVGCIDKNTKGVGKPFLNVALMIHKGQIRCRYSKHLLPFYDVFDEGRYFEPGEDTTVFEIDGVKFGLSICEDLWNDKEQREINYFTNPVQKYRDLQVDCLINISSSPYSKGKPALRQRMIDHVSESFRYGIIYVNQVGGQDELVFDGCSTYSQQYGGNGFSHARAIMFCESDNYRILELNSDESHREDKSLLDDSIYYVHDVLLIGLRDYLKKSGFNSIVLGSSGGIDSALVACLASKILGPENVHCIMMPSVFSSDHSVADAKKLHENLGCNEYTLPIAHTEVVEDLSKRLLGDLGINNGGKHSVADENIQARMRGSYVMWFSNAYGAMTLTTGNKTELALGYATLYGDMCGGYAPICDLYKMEVYDIARYFYSNVIPKNILDKKPSAELAEGQFDDNELLPYPILDKIVELYIEENVHQFDEFLSTCDERQIEPELCNELCKADYDKMISRIDGNEYKRRQYAPGTKVRRKSFGIGRRIPIVKGRKQI